VKVSRYRPIPAEEEIYYIILHYIILKHIAVFMDLMFAY